MKFSDGKLSIVNFDLNASRHFLKKYFFNVNPMLKKLRIFLSVHFRLFFPLIIGDRYSNRSSISNEKQIRDFDCPSDRA